MSRRVVIGLGVAAVVLVAGWVWAQQKPEAEAKPAGPAGRYTVSPAGDTAILIDTATGRAWVLTPSAVRSEASAWLPTLRIDTDKDAERWLARQRELGDR